MSKIPRSIGIIQLTQSACQLIIASCPDFVTMPQMEQTFKIIKWLTSENGKEFQQKVSTDISFRKLRSGWLQIPTMGMAIQDHMLPIILIRSCLDGQAPDSIIDAARHFAESGKATIDQYVPLAGIEIDDIIHLSETADLLPWSEVPNSKNKVRFDSISDPTKHFGSDFPRFAAKAAAAIRHRSFRKILFDSSDKAISDQAAVAEATEDLNSTVVLCFVAQHAKPAASLGSWVQTDSDFLERLISSGYSWTNHLFEPQLWGSAQKLDVAGFKKIFDSYSRFPLHERKILKIGLSRLSSALLESSPVDKLIDLGIALESLLLKDIGGTERGELRYRMAVRGATFLGGDRQNQLKTFKLLKDAYDCRSSAVHTGEIRSNNGGSAGTSQTIDATLDACAAVARKLVELGKFPDWERDFVIANGS